MTTNLNDLAEIKNFNDCVSGMATLANWHLEQASALEHAAQTTALDKPEPVKSLLLKKAQGHRKAHELLIFMLTISR